MVNDKELKEKQQKALDMIKAVYKDGFAEINGNRYDFAAMTHKKRRKVFAFFTGIASELSRQSLEFLDTERFEEIERLMFDYVLYDGVQLSKQADHFESFPGDYVMVVTHRVAGHQPAFYGREHYELNFRSSRRSEDYVKKSNVSDEMSMYLALSKAGYGSYSELVKLDTPELLDMLEF
ncbi:Uncharacterised protein [Kluyvera cryocrescens]|uniref:Uncharacterized protein n=1 Tax=Kluyvera cryocrescens TaxID=580 RepID=A0A485BNG1_KLUCR|nr:Uncharacterised protein [Kluyvera cryocrescens]